jgi:hypothetical protein
MTSRDFAYWLQGFFEINGVKKGGYEITDEQIDIIKSHLNLVFKHEIDPSLNEGKSKEEVKELQDVHDGKKKLSDFIKEGPLPKKDKGVVDWLSGKFKPSHINRPKSWLDDNWRPGRRSDDDLLRC